MTSPTNTDTRSGIINAISAYLMWGVAPLFFKLLTDIAPSEILVHRVVWSCVLLSIIVLAMGKWRHVQHILKQPRMIAKLTITALFLATNWFMFIWAINNDHILDASLGYYINPLFSVFLGMVFLGERLRAWQKFAVLLAFLGVLIQFIVIGSLPFVSLALAGTFGIYGLLRKKMQVDSFVGLLIESIVMLPIALIFWQFFLNSPTVNMFNNSLSLNTTLILTGIVTTAPLLCFTAAAKRLTLAALGFFQYIGPSLMFILAIVLYNEPLVPAKLATFACIWLALIIYSVDSIKARRARAKA
jgi:chloramphenicol-sensitive protein RarD